jgi:hypothetical protein
MRRRTPFLGAKFVSRCSLAPRRARKGTEKPELHREIARGAPGSVLAPAAMSRVFSARFRFLGASRRPAGHKKAPRKRLCTEKSLRHPRPPTLRSNKGAGRTGRGQAVKTATTGQALDADPGAPSRPAQPWTRRKGGQPRPAPPPPNPGRPDLTAPFPADRRKTTNAAGNRPATGQPRTPGAPKGRRRAGPGTRSDRGDR